MNPSSSDADLHRAARAGRRALALSLPPAFLRWIDRLAGEHDSPEEVLALAGALAAIALEFEQSFARAGTEVRDLILRLHDFLAQADASANVPAVAPPPFAGFEPFVPWLRARLVAPAPGHPPRLVILQWIDVASERLTLRRYHRPDLPAHHAAVLIARPVRMLGFAAAAPTNPDALPRRDPLDEVALVLLRFIDLLDAERLGGQGKNRAPGYHPADIGGFYGISENVQPPSRETLDALQRDLRAAALSMADALEGSPALHTPLREIASALTQKIQSGDWPADLRWKSPVDRRPRPLWRRLLGG